MFHWVFENGNKKNCIFYGSLSLFLLIGLVVFLMAPKAALADQAVVKGSVINLRASPGTNSSIVGKASQGESLNIIGKQGDWLKTSKNGVVAWVAGWLVEQKTAATPVPAGQVIVPPVTTPANTVEITSESVNIRGGPGTSYNIMGKAGKGSKYKVIEKSGDWYKISLDVGTGWVYGQYAKVTAQTTTQGSMSNTRWAVINSTGVNIRNGPGTHYPVVAKANKGERFLLADKSSDWYKIIAGGKLAWVASWLVEVDGTPSGNTVPPSQSKPLPPNGGIPATPVPGGSSNPGGGSIPPHSANPGTPQGGVLPPPSVEPGEPPVSKPVITLKSVTSRLDSAKTVITVQSNEPIDYTVSSLWNPDRLVIDIKDQAPGTVPESISLSSPLAGGIRVGWFSKEPNITRIVVDLKTRVRYEKKLSSDSKTLQLILAPRGSRSLSGLKIVLDPGHGGSDPGAVGPTGIKEKDVNLAIAQKTVQLLKKQGATVILTRTTDVYIGLADRPAIANTNDAALFLSIHANANVKSSANGTSTYHLRSAIEGIDQARFEGMYLARTVQSAMLNILNREDRGVLQADYAVLTRSQVPAALAEVAFISNAEEEKMLADPVFQDKVAQALAQGIADYFAGK